MAEDISLNINIDLAALERDLRSAERMTKQYADRLNRAMNSPTRTTGSAGGLSPTSFTSGGGGGASSAAAIAAASTMATRAASAAATKAASDVAAKAIKTVSTTTAREVAREVAKAIPERFRKRNPNDIVGFADGTTMSGSQYNQRFARGSRFAAPVTRTGYGPWTGPGLPILTSNPNTVGGMGTFAGVNSTISGTTTSGNFPFTAAQLPASVSGNAALPVVQAGLMSRMLKYGNKPINMPSMGSLYRATGLAATLYGVNSLSNARGNYYDSMRNIPSWTGHQYQGPGADWRGIGFNSRGAGDMAGAAWNFMANGNTNSWSRGRGEATRRPYEGLARSQYLQDLHMPFGGNSAGIWQAGVATQNENYASRVASQRERGAFGRSTLWQGQDLVSSQLHSNRTAGLGGLDKALADVFEGAAQKAREIEREFKSNPVLSMSGDAQRQMRQQQQQAFGAAEVQAGELRRANAYDNSQKGFALRADAQSMFLASSKDFLNARRVQINAEIDLEQERDRKENQGALRQHYEQVRRQRLFQVDLERNEDVRDRVIDSNMSARQSKLIMDKKYDQAEVQAVRDVTTRKYNELKKAGLLGTPAEAALMNEGHAAEMQVLTAQRQRKAENLTSAKSTTRQMNLQQNRKYLEADLEGVRENYRQQIKQATEAGEMDKVKELQGQQRMAEIQAAKDDIARRSGVHAISTTGRTMSYAGIAADAARGAGIISNAEAAQYLGKKGYGNENEMVGELKKITGNTAKLWPVAGE